jgi:hypothetical protein
LASLTVAGSIRSSLAMGAKTRPGSPPLSVVNERVALQEARGEWSLQRRGWAGGWGTGGHTRVHKQHAFSSSLSLSPSLSTHQPAGTIAMAYGAKPKK